MLKNIRVFVIVLCLLVPIQAKAEALTAISAALSLISAITADDEPVTRENYAPKALLFTVITIMETFSFSSDDYRERLAVAKQFYSNDVVTGLNKAFNNSKSFNRLKKENLTSFVLTRVSLAKLQTIGKNQWSVMVPADVIFVNENKETVCIDTYRFVATVALKGNKFQIVGLQAAEGKQQNKP